ncbi:MAG: DUF1929 domain-containing protein [Beijerinckiaceae bacterium]|nr:DUF1929 domain-containing protein [Beijerinckiaceae bacterium]
MSSLITPRLAGLALALMSSSAATSAYANDYPPRQLVSKTSPNSCLSVDSSSIVFAPCTDVPGTKRDEQLWVHTVNSLPDGKKIATLRNKVSNLCLANVLGLGLKNCADAPVVLARRGADVQIFLGSVGAGSCVRSSFSSKVTVKEDCTGAGRTPPADELWTFGAPDPAKRHVSWSSLDFGFVGVSAAHMTDGNIFLWSGANPASPGGYDPASQKTRTIVFDTGTKSTRAASVLAGQLYYDAGQALDKNGHLVIAGGLTFIKNTSHLVNGQLETSIPMVEGVRSNTLVTLANGKILTVGGAYDRSLTPKQTAEIFDGTTWKRLDGIRPVVTHSMQNNYPVALRRMNDMWVFASSDENYAFQAGPSKAMHWLNTSGNGSLQKVATRSEDAIGGSAVMYAPGKILVTGGSTNGVWNAPAFKHTYTVEIDGGQGRKATPTVTKAPSSGEMKHARNYHNSVVLPNGEVLIVGGASTAGIFSDRSAVKTAEIWNPVDGKFRDLTQPLPRARTQGSTALLLPDATVLVAGGAYCPKANCLEKVVTRTGTGAEILKPPYLFNADTTPAKQPEIMTKLKTFVAGGTVGIVTDVPVSRFSLVRMSATSGGVNSDQRFIEVPSSLAVGKTSDYVLAVPTQAKGVIPGKYMLFAIDGNGVPSKAKIIQID